MIRQATLKDASQIAEIYNYYIENTVVSFETEKIDWEEMQKRMKDVIPAFPWLVIEENGLIQGYAYANKWNNRCAYEQSVETSIYLRNGSTGKGIGYALYKHLIDSLIDKKYHALIGGISLPNAASQSLHEKLGYTKVAHFKETGFKFGKYIDVGYWEKILD